MANQGGTVASQGGTVGGTVANQGGTVGGRLRGVAPAMFNGGALDAAVL